MSACASGNLPGQSLDAVTRDSAFVALNVSVLGRVDQTFAEVGLGQKSFARYRKGFGVVSQQEMDPILDMESLSSNGGGNHGHTVSE